MTPSNCLFKTDPNRLFDSVVSLTYHESRELTLEQSVSTNWSNRFFAVCLKILLILYILRLSASKTLGYSKYELHVEQKSFAFELVLISDYFLHFKNQLDCQKMSRHELVSYCLLRYTCRLFPFYIFNFRLIRLTQANLIYM